MHLDKQPEWLRLSQCAEILQMHYRTVLALISSGRLKARNFATRDKKPCWRVHVQWLKEYQELVPQQELD